MIGWWFCKYWTTKADYRGDSIKYALFIALKGCIYMAVHQMSLISVLIILYHTCITFEKFGQAQGNARPTGADKGVSSGFDQFL